MALTISLAWLSACEAPPEADYTAIAEAVAEGLDPVNGLPDAVLNAYSCAAQEEMCAELPNGQPVSPLDATNMARPFAAALGVPLFDAQRFASRRCDWDDAESPRGSGLHAHFVRPPDVRGDSATIELASGCTGPDGAAFLQIHHFVLVKSGLRWRVVRRELTSIT
jgi:hypothetical protein